jgi:UDP-N-acetylglucosamine--N-acetylmuramyl-(pentapeptide) pyrophosphoryl-undecaprenol N-acetylglucosamine transferase
MTTFLIAGGGTGGHLMPALAVAERLVSDRPDVRVVLVGAQRGVEARLLPLRQWPYQLLPTEPIYRRQWWRNARWPFLAVRLVRQVDRLLDAERPAVVLGTGGYASGPVVWRAAGRGIPSAVLEQDAVPGLATRWLARRVREVYLAVPEAARHLTIAAGGLVHVTGAPILPPDESLRARAHAHFGIDPLKPTVLVTGGSQGSLALNEVVAQWLASGAAASCQVLWATGTATYPRFAHLHAPPAVTVVDFLDPMAPALAAATIAVTRAGMMTIAELCAWGIPAILVPLPTAAADHQTNNARVLDEARAAILLPQAELSPARLAREVAGLLENAPRRAAMTEAAKGRARPGATAEIAARLLGLAGLR